VERVEVVQGDVVMDGEEEREEDMDTVVQCVEE